jgi:hypothetical protein
MKEERNTDFIIFDDGLVLNKNHIRWIKKIHDCMYICTKSSGCSESARSSHVICSSNENQKKDFDKINQIFR